MECKECPFWNETTGTCADYAGYVDENNDTVCRYSGDVSLVQTVIQKLKVHDHVFHGINEDMFECLAIEITELLTNNLKK